MGRIKAAMHTQALEFHWAETIYFVSPAQYLEEEGRFHMVKMKICNTETAT